MEGKVKWFNNLKNFGFITPDDGSKDVFVHRSGLKEGVSITENDRVSFEVKQGDKGLTAVEVAKISAAGESAPSESVKPKKRAKSKE